MKKIIRLTESELISLVKRVINEGLHDTSWQNDEGDKITLMDLLNATEDIPVETSAPSVSTYTKPRGSFAEAVAEQTEVKQELLTPAGSKNQGVKRI